MTERELKKLNRMELLEMLLAVTRENERLAKEVSDLRAALEDRRLTVEKTGSIAEAALTLNGVFEAAQAAADQYLVSIQNREEASRRMLAEARRALTEARRQCVEEPAAQAPAEDCASETAAKTVDPDGAACAAAVCEEADHADDA